MGEDEWREGGRDGMRRVRLEKDEALGMLCRVCVVLGCRCFFSVASYWLVERVA